LRTDVAFAMEQYEMSERQACKLVDLDRSSYRYEPRPDHNAERLGYRTPNEFAEVLKSSVMTG